MKYYAVVCGVQPGIYTDWATAEKMVKGFSGAIFKSFRTRLEAEAFIEKSKPCPTRLEQTQTIVQPQVLPLIDQTLIYTDGSMQNGKCGFGVIIITSNGDKLTAYGRVPADLGITNNVAELYAIYVALSLVKGNVLLYSDSTYAIGVLTGWNAVANRELIKAILQLIPGREVTLQHVRSHSGFELNEEVDELADLGREQTEPLVVLKNGQRLAL